MEQNLAAARGAPHNAMHIFLESNNSQRFVRSIRLKRKSLCYAESFVGRISYFRPSSLAVLVDRGSLGDRVCVTQRLCKGFKCFRIFQVVVGDVDTIVFCCSDLVDSISNSDGQWLSSRTQGSKSLIVVDAVVPVCSVVAVYFHRSCRYIEIQFNTCFVECFAMVILFSGKQLGPTR